MESLDDPVEHNLRRSVHRSLREMHGKKVLVTSFTGGIFCRDTPKRNRYTPVTENLITHITGTPSLETGTKSLCLQASEFFILGSRDFILGRHFTVALHHKYLSAYILGSACLHFRPRCLYFEALISDVLFYRNLGACRCSLSGPISDRGLPS